MTLNMHTTYESYSQTNQDLWVIENTNYKHNGYFLDIGANDAKINNNSYLLETEFHWDGLCIDLLLTNMETRKCKSFKGLVSNKNEIVDFLHYHRSNDTSDTGLSGIKGLNIAHKNNNDLINAISTKEQTHITQDILDKFNVPAFINFMSLDVEGNELNVLKGIDFNKHSFGIIIVEHNSVQPLRDHIRTFLESKGYKYECTNQQDDVYVILQN